MDVRRLHRHDAQQLQQVVLHHVAQRTGAVVEIAARLHAHLLGERDLHVADPGAVPQRFQQRVGEAQREQVLHRLLAQVVVDAKDLRFGEDAAHVLVDLLRGSQVASQGLFQHHPRVGADQPGGRQVLADGREELRCRRQEEDPHVGRRILQCLRQRGEVLRCVGVGLDVVQSLDKGIEVRLVHLRGRNEAGEVRRHLRDEVAAGQALASRGDDAAMRRQVAVSMAVVQRGQQLAHREVAGAAEKKQVERRDLWHARGGHFVCASG